MKQNTDKTQLPKHIVNSRFYTCAGCRALFKTTNNGEPFVWCYLNKKMVETEKGYFDKRLDFEVFRKPIDNCKVKTKIAMVAVALNGLKIMRLTYNDVDMLAEKCGLTKRQFLMQSETTSAYWTSKSRGCDLIPHKTSEKIINFAESKGINLNSEGISLNC